MLAHLKSWQCCLLIGIIACCGCTYASIEFTIQGISSPPLLQAINNNLDLISAKEGQTTGPQTAYLLTNQGKKQAISALNAYGYFNSHIQTKTQHNGHGQWLVTYDITPGKPTLINNVAINLLGPGENNKALLRLVKTGTPKPKSTFIYSQYAKLRDQLMTTANDQGYFDAKLSQHQVKISRETHLANITLQLSTGQRYHFGPLIQQQTPHIFANTLIQRLSPFVTKQAYDAKLVQQLRSNLNASGFFADYRVTPKPDKQSKSVPIELHLKPKKDHSYTLGLGYGTATQLRALLGWSWHNLTASGQHFSAKIQYSKVYLRFLASYIIPGKNPLTDRTSLNVGQNDTDITPYNAQETIIGADWVSTWHHWQWAANIHEHLIRYTTDGQNDPTHRKYLIPSLGLQYKDFSDTQAYWPQGYAISLQTQGAVNSVLSSQTFLQAQVDLDYSHNLSTTQRFFTNIDLGATATKDITALAPSLRYYAGGDGSVRGYLYKTLAPRNDQANLLGGRYLLSASANLEQHLFGITSAFLFYDLGNAFDQFNHINLYRSAGLGLSLKTGVGAIQLYIAHPYAENQPKFRFGLTISGSL